MLCITSRPNAARDRLQPPCDPECRISSDRNWMDGWMDAVHNTKQQQEKNKILRRNKKLKYYIYTVYIYTNFLFFNFFLHLSSKWKRNRKKSKISNCKPNDKLSLNIIWQMFVKIQITWQLYKTNINQPIWENVTGFHHIQRCVL